MWGIIPGEPLFQLIPAWVTPVLVVAAAVFVGAGSYLIWYGMGVRNGTR